MYFNVVWGVVPYVCPSLPLEVHAMISMIRYSMADDPSHGVAVEGNDGYYHTRPFIRGVEPYQD